MKKKETKKQKELIEQQIDHAFFEHSDTASFGECTGLMYRPPQNEFEEKSYDHIYHFLPDKDHLLKKEKKGE